MIDEQSYISSVATTRQDLARGTSLDEVLATLRKSGFSQLDCYRAVLDLTGCTRRKAKESVYFSSAWADAREGNDALQESLNTLTDENAPKGVKGD